MTNRKPNPKVHYYSHCLLLICRQYPTTQYLTNYHWYIVLVFTLIVFCHVTLITCFIVTLRALEFLAHMNRFLMSFSELPGSRTLGIGISVPYELISDELQD